MATGNVMLSAVTACSECVSNIHLKQSKEVSKTLMKLFAKKYISPEGVAVTVQKNINIST